jgi:hypothetical protein
MASLPVSLAACRTERVEAGASQRITKQLHVGVAAACENFPP